MSASPSLPIVRPLPEETEQQEWEQARRLLDEGRRARESLFHQAQLSAQREWIELRGLLSTRPDLLAETLALVRAKVGG